MSQLNLASKNGHIEEVRLLLERGTNVNAFDEKGNTPLIFSSNNGHIDVVRLLLEKGANVNAVNQYGNTALILASFNGHTEIVRLLLDRGANVNAVKKNGDTALILASFNGHTDVVRLLLERGANVNAVNQYGDTALTSASKNGRINVVRLLLERGTNVNAFDEKGNTPLIFSSNNGHIDVVRLLLEKGANVNAVNQYGNTALILASFNGHTEIVRLLLDRGANVNAVKKNGDTALTIASYNGHIDVVRLLLERGANVNAVNQYGDTALTSASKNGRINVVRLLLDKGANIDVTNQDGNTALDIASDNGYTDIVRLLNSYIRKRGTAPDITRLTTDWMEICSQLGNSKLTELRNIIKNNVVKSNFNTVKLFFDYSGPSLSGFKTYISTLSKRKLCIGLARYYHHQTNITYTHEGCTNEESFTGDLIANLPPERIIKLEQNGVVYCFDVLEVASFEEEGINPYNRLPLPESFLKEALKKAKKAKKAKNIHELKQRIKSSIKTPNPLRDEVMALQDRADEIVPYFPRAKFVTLTTKRLIRLAEELAEYDPDFNLARLRREALSADSKDRLLVWKRGIVKRLLVHPQVLGVVLRMVLTPIPEDT